MSETFLNCEDNPKAAFAVSLFEKRTRVTSFANPQPQKRYSWVIREHEHASVAA
jgi:hypothetical protein